MEIVYLGAYIKQKREELGLTQAQLCEGICEPMTLSRMENGKQTPSRIRINALLQRLGLPDDRYFALLPKNELEIENLLQEIGRYALRFCRAPETDRPRIRAEALEKIAALEAAAEPDDRVTRQEALGFRASIGKPEGPYTLEERLELLMEAIRLTVPRFDPENIGANRYSTREIKIINQIAISYKQAGQLERAIAMYRDLMAYLEAYAQDLDGFARYYCLIASNCAIALEAAKRYEEAAELAEKGWRLCVRSGHYQSLPSFLGVLAECALAEGDREKSAALYCQSYYLYRATSDEYAASVVKREMEKMLGVGPPY